MRHTLFCLHKHDRKGFSLLEVIVALSIFTLIVTSLTRVAGSSFSGYTKARQFQQDLENAGFAMDNMAKVLRTSTVLSSANGTATTIQAFDYSQNKCVEYRFASNNLQIGFGSGGSAADPSACDFTGISRNNVIAGVVQGGSFSIAPSLNTSGSEEVGKVTIALRVGENATNTANLQTSVSLRDYANVGL